ncbi:MAG TPA: four helix bundle protein [Cryomorphaceae bacterium]|nr:four helix bundle protein [Owenweeksia sp.]HBF20282.1 four helix bundle protein [Cryomorphaceae bacterium]HCQ16729.1 four helix bundle protein [Cryomorphaceae bacterium]|tara:strand:- start:7 stop:435 length:429 start_codon:yes stop_codon:yes gene_type:complete
MGKIEKFEDLRIWQQARELSQWFFHLKKTSELGSDFKLCGQADRSIGSVMDNIAEGFERNGKREFLNFLSIAKGSAGEFRSQLYRIYDRIYINEKELNQKLESCEQLSKGISSFMNYIASTELPGWKFREEQQEYKRQEERP